MYAGRKSDLAVLRTTLVPTAVRLIKYWFRPSSCCVSFITKRGTYDSDLGSVCGCIGSDHCPFDDELVLTTVWLRSVGSDLTVLQSERQSDQRCLRGPLGCDRGVSADHLVATAVSPRTIWLRPRCLRGSFGCDRGVSAVSPSSHILPSPPCPHIPPRPCSHIPSSYSFPTFLS